MRRGALLVAAGLALASCAHAPEQAPMAAATGEARIETLSATQLAALVAAGKVVLIDVRTPAEFAEMRIAGALLAPLDTFDPASIPQEAARETILYCRSSRRSAVAAQQLADYLGRPVRHLDGGISAWQEAGFDVITAGEAATAGN